MKKYAECAKSGIEKELPKLDVWKNQFSGYEIRIDFPEFNSLCPSTGLPDLGTIIIIYEPDKLCVEMKSLKLYLTAYRNIGIFQENAVNRIFNDFVKFVKPKKLEVRGIFNPRGGMKAEIAKSKEFKNISG